MQPAPGQGKRGARRRPRGLPDGGARIRAAAAGRARAVAPCRAPVPKGPDRDPGAAGVGSRRDGRWALGGRAVRILVVYQYYLQPGHPGFSRYNAFARFWTAAGHQVTVVAGTVDYASGRAPRKYWWRWNTRERDGATTVWRCHVPQTYGRSYLGRMWAFFCFTLSAATAALRCGGVDVVVASSPPLVVAFPAWLAARLHRARLIFEVRDLHPESAVTTGVLAPGALLTRLLYAVERWAYRAADRVNVLTPAFREDLLRRGVAPDGKIVLVPNGADLDLFAPGPRDNAVRRELGWGDRFVVMYAGAHGRANAVGQLLDAAERLRDRPDVLIATVGDGPERARLVREARARGLDNVAFCGPQPKARMAEVVNACDVGAAVLQDNPTFRTVYPNKVFDYMACARPTLLAIDGAARRLVCDEARAGVFAAPEDGRAIAAAIRRLADDPAECAELGRRGREWVLASASREALAGRYLAVMEEALSGPRDRLGYRAAKRIMDLALSAAGLVLLAPLLAAAALAVKLSSPGPVLYRQERLGLGGRPFRILKLRSMRDGTPGPEVTAAGDGRVTGVGRLLRRTKIDELPQLWNVLAGDMSLVGPRPEVRRYAERYAADYARILAVRPGITDMAAVEYIDEEAILSRAPDPEAAYVEQVLPAKIRLYHRYLAERSLRTDLRLIVRTLAHLLP